jgi:hypothetical protein
VLFRFLFVTADGLRREVRFPLDDPSQPLLRCSLQLDMAQGTVDAWLNRQQITPDLRLLNDSWTGAALAANWCAHFHLRRVLFADTGKDPNVKDPNSNDVTFGALRISDTALYRDSPQQQTLAGTPVTDADWRGAAAQGFSCWLPMDEPTHKNAGLPDLQFPGRAEPMKKSGSPGTAPSCDPISARIPTSPGTRSRRWPSAVT